MKSTNVLLFLAALQVTAGAAAENQGTAPIGATADELMRYLVSAQAAAPLAADLAGRTERIKKAYVDYVLLVGSRALNQEMLELQRAMEKIMRERYASG